jgi:hypothetical protein
MNDSRMCFTQINTGAWALATVSLIVSWAKLGAAKSVAHSTLSPRQTRGNNLPACIIVGISCVYSS